MLRTITQTLSRVVTGRSANSNVKAGVLERPVVLNSNDDHADPQVIRLLVNTIFDGDKDLIEAAQVAVLDTGSIKSLAHAEALIGEYVQSALQDGHYYASRLAAAFYTHKARSEANWNAYSPSTKPKPSAVYWPNPCSKDATNLRTELPYVHKYPLIDKKTAIASAGSCFAVEIAYALQREGYNYVVKEPNVCPQGTYRFKDADIRPFVTSSAAWGVHFNTPSFLQLVEKAFGYRRPAKILWTTKGSNGETVYCDPFREEVEFPTIEGFEKNYDAHLAAVRSVFLETEVFIITLGLNEVWYFKPDGTAFSRSPWRTAPSLVEHKILTVEENVELLQRMLDILREHNPNLKLIVTLSPVPLHATFFGDKHVVEANTHSKAVLRCAAETFVRMNKDVFYFPSFELITTCLQDPWDTDQRHVSRAAVDRVMEMFHQMYSR